MTETLVPDNLPEAGFYYNYKHDTTKGYADNAYEVMGTAHATEKKCPPEYEWTVTYRPLYQDAFVYQKSLEHSRTIIDSKPLSEFIKEVKKNEIMVPRFQKIKDPHIINLLTHVRDVMYNGKHL